MEAAGTDDVNAIGKNLKNQSMNAPEGIVYIDGETQHTWKSVRIGKIQEGGQFQVVWNSGKPIRPIPYPLYRTRNEWDKFLQGLYTRWGGSWANPGTN